MIFFILNFCCLLNIVYHNRYNFITKIKVLNRIKKRGFINLAKTIALAFYLSFAMIKVAFAPVAKFHSLEEINRPASLKTLNAAVFGPEVPWFNASITILLIPSSKGILNF